MTDTKDDTRKYRKITPDFYKFEKPGDFVAGRLIMSDKVEMQEGPVSRYTLSDDMGGLVAFLGSKIIDSSLALVADDTWIKVIFVGQTKTLSGRPVNKFDVYVESE